VWLAVSGLVPELSMFKTKFTGLDLSIGDIERVTEIDVSCFRCFFLMTTNSNFSGVSGKDKMVTFKFMI
jgi:hypothetical protein